jgi:hypothetical protein
VATARRRTNRRRLIGARAADRPEDGSSRFRGWSQCRARRLSATAEASAGDRERFANGAPSLVDRRVGISPRARIRIRDHDSAERRAAHDVGLVGLIPVRIEQRIVFVGVAVWPAIDRDTCDARRRIESCRSEAEAGRERCARTSRSWRQATLLVPRGIAISDRGRGCTARGSCAPAPPKAIWPSAPMLMTPARK